MSSERDVSLRVAFIKRRPLSKPGAIPDRGERTYKAPPKIPALSPSPPGSRDAVPVPRVARAESVRGAAGPAAGRAPTSAEAGEGAFAAGHAAAALALFLRLERAGRGAHRGPGAPQEADGGSRRRVVRRARALQPRPERGVARVDARARLVVPPPQSRARLHPLLPLQDMRLQVPLLLLRAQAQEEVSRGRGYARVAGAVHV
ncbi:unnamed protein product [Leptosia nina]|uniref:Uncharacterized protein n=1 Tax=Leptosia nina TaxID=320188 RepID=A0AAV1IYZ6_9NEOP